MKRIRVSANPHAVLEEALVSSVKFAIRRATKHDGFVDPDVEYRILECVRHEFWIALDGVRITR